MGGICSVGGAADRFTPRNLLSRGDQGNAEVSAEAGDGSELYVSRDGGAGYAPAATVPGGDCVAEEQWTEVTESHLVRLYQNSENFYQREGGLMEPMTLLDLCVRSICQSLPLYDKGFPALLPREVVDKLLASLTKHQALFRPALSAFKECEVTTIALSGCRGVRDDWLAPLRENGRALGRSLLTLDLSGCEDLTDRAFVGLGALPSLERASLRNCRGLGGLAPRLLLAGSPDLSSLSLAHCPQLKDGAIRSLAHLPSLSSLDLEDCEGVTDEALKHVVKLSALTYLNLSRCHGLTPNGLACLAGLPGLRALNLGWCCGLALEAAEDDEEGADSDEDLDGEGDSVSEPQWRLPKLPALERLCLARCGVVNRSLARLSADPPPLVDLDISGCRRITTSAVAALSCLSALTALNVNGCRGVRQGPVGVAPGPGGAAASTTGPPLQTLNMAGSGLGDAELQAMAPGMTGLTSLNLDSCSVGDAGVCALSGLTALEALNLADTDVTNVGLESIAPLLRLRSLSLFFCPVSDAGLPHLARLTALTYLNLDTRDVTDAGLAQLGRLRRLRTLEVFSAQVSDFGLAHTVCRFPALTSLEVGSGRVTDRGLMYLGKASGLTSVNVSQNTRVTSEGVAHLSGLTNLRSLNISSCSVTPTVVPHLAGLVNLQSLAVFGCGLSRQDVAKLHAQLPNLRAVRA